MACSAQRVLTLLAIGLSCHAQHRVTSNIELGRRWRVGRQVRSGDCPVPIAGRGHLAIVSLLSVRLGLAGDLD